MNKINPKEIETHPTFESLFPINPTLLAKIEQDMCGGTYDASQPIILATWQGQAEPVCIDGHTRRQAAMNVGIQQVPVWVHEFDTEEEAVEKAIKLQRNRRNMTDAEILTCIQTLDQRGRAGRPKQELAQGCANFYDDEGPEDTKNNRESCPVAGAGKSAQAIGEMLGISTRKVEQMRTVMDHADEATKEAVKQGDLSINQAYEETQKKRRETKKASAQDPKDSQKESGQGASWPEPVLKATAETEESSASQNDPPTSLGKSVTVYLPDWQYFALIRMDAVRQLHWSENDN
jgi:hypothetical protein